MIEEWRDIVGYEGIYKVSNFGRVKSLSRVTQLNGRTRTEPETIMAVTYRAGYQTLILRKCGKKKSAQVHRLVAEAFLPNPNGFPIVNHKDEDRTNNCVSNLEWCTQQHNVLWSARKMRKPKSICKSTNTGEKYISKRGKAYRVSIHSANHAFCDKIFPTLEEAIEFRNAEIQRIWATAQ